MSRFLAVAGLIPVLLVSSYALGQQCSKGCFESNSYAYQALGVGPFLVGNCYIANDPKANWCDPSNADMAVGKGWAPPSALKFAWKKGVTCSGTTLIDVNSCQCKLTCTKVQGQYPQYGGGCTDMPVSAGEFKQGSCACK